MYMKKVLLGTLSMLLLVLSYPLLMGQAAPSVLPSCGHNSISDSPSVRSGQSDFVRSADKQKVAVVWAEGTESEAKGPIKLAYSDVLTTTRQWTSIIIDSDETGQKPSMVFDPTDNNLVHIAYEKNYGITYARCNLAGTCTIKSLNTGSVSNYWSNPSIVVNDNGTPLIVYQENSTTIKYTYIPNGGTGSFAGQSTNGFALSDDGTSNSDPSASYSNNKVHVAYVDNKQIEYVNLEASTLSSGSAITASNRLKFSNSGNATVASEGADNPVVVAKDAWVAVVWDMAFSDSKKDFFITDDTHYALVYNLSRENGTKWIDGASYRYVLSNARGASQFQEAVDYRTQAQGNVYSRLQPDLDMSVDSTNVGLHVVWHERSNPNDAVTGRNDVMYTETFFENNTDTNSLPPNLSTKWGLSQIISPTTQVVSYTNVTSLYIEAGYQYDPENKSVKYDNGAPQVLYGEPGKRVQIVYNTETAGNGYDIMYNGWQRADTNNTESFIYKYDDFDCDTVSNVWELEVPATYGTGQEICPNGKMTDRNEFDCDGDYVPDFLDTNSDNDTGGDDIENIIEIRKPGSTNYGGNGDPGNPDNPDYEDKDGDGQGDGTGGDNPGRNPSDGGNSCCAFLPIIVK